MKETEDDTETCKDILCSWIGRINIVKMFILHKAVYISDAIAMTRFNKLGQIILKCMQNHKRPQVATAILKKKYKTQIIMLPGFRLYYKFTVIKTAWNWNKNRHID